MAEKKIIGVKTTHTPKSGRTPERLDLLSEVEPFLDFDLAAMRHKLIDDLIINQHRTKILSRLSNQPREGRLNVLLDVLAETQAEIHYLKAAYINRTRYQEPSFEINLPKMPPKLFPNVFDIDMRCDLTGTGWWQIEEDGRWAGPDNQASIQIPSLGAGSYLLEIIVLAEIDTGIVDSMTTTLNGRDVSLVRCGLKFPANWNAQVVISEDYKLPFWTLKFYFQRLVSPKEKGCDDNRHLSIKVERICFTRIEQE